MTEPYMLKSIADVVPLMMWLGAIAWLSGEFSGYYNRYWIWLQKPRGDKQ